MFFEHRELGQDVGQSNSSIRSLDRKKQGNENIIEDVTVSIKMKVHDDALLRGKAGRGAI